MKFKCIITDDEPLAHSVLKEYIKSNEQLELVKQCYSARECRDYVFNNTVDILFLDIEMPEENGIRFLQSIQNKPITIFTTAYLNYSLEGFELGVLDYLVKPIRFERFQIAANRAIEFLKLQALQSKIELENPIHSQILIKTGTKKILLDRPAITHVQALKDYMIIYCGTKKHVVRSTMTEMIECLGGDGFLRVHKSFIIAKDKIKFLTSTGIEFEQFEIPVGRKYKAEVEAFIGNTNI
jgi:DNA-binding LytR/AlgR family response regulator